MPDRTQQTSRGWYECEYCFDIHLYFIGIYRFWVNRIVIVSQEAKQQNILSSVNLNIYSIAAVIDSIVTRFTIGLLWLKIIKQSSFFCKEKRRKQHFIAHTIYRAYIRTATVQRHHQPTKYLLIPSSDNKGCCGSFCPSPGYRVYTHTTYLPAVFLNVKRHSPIYINFKTIIVKS